jgi:hypothetical protein
MIRNIQVREDAEAVGHNLFLLLQEILASQLDIFLF